MFVGRISTLSPFCKFNLSSIINYNKIKNENNIDDITQLKTRSLIENVLIMNDIWNLMFNVFNNFIQY